MAEKKEEKILEQTKVLENKKKNMIVSASAGSGKTFVMIKYVTELVCERKIPLKDIVVLTFTKAAAAEMKERLEKSLRKQKQTAYVVEQIDSLPTANISTIDSFCEKNLKKYANLVGLSETFSVLDANLDEKLKKESFDKAIKLFKQTEPEKYVQLVEIFKNNIGEIREIVFSIESLVDVVSDRNDFLQKNMKNAESYFDKAADFLVLNFKNMLNKIFEKIEKLHLVEYENAVRKNMGIILQAKDIFELCSILNNVEMPDRPKKKDVGEEVFDLLGKLKELFEGEKEKILDLDLLDNQKAKMQREGILEKSFLSLFLAYEKIESETKLARNCLSFSDLSKFMVKLSEKENLFGNVKYVFIDEYQDTSKIQERIVKNIAKNCNFVAVGDVKQGIYGFRLADSEIFLKDVKDFDENEDSAVNYLKENFRSDERVLNFINKVFDVCMREENTGVEYKKDADLHAFHRFKNDGSKAVTIHVVKEEKPEEETLPELYSVKNAKIELKNSDLKQMLDIREQIFVARKTKIYEDEEFRDCKFGDIAILSRSRSDLYFCLEEFLIESGIPVGTDSKKKLLDEVEIKVLLNFLKISLIMEDDIATLSVLLSPIGGFTLEEIIKEKGTQTICEMVQNNQKFASVIKKIEDFKRNMSVFGAKKAFDLLFIETKYRSYLNSKQDFKMVNEFVDAFLQNVQECGFEYDLPSLINYFENVDIDVENLGQVQDGVILETIHASKGLEYPVVFLIGCDKDFMKVSGKENRNVRIDENFGFAVKDFNVDENENSTSVRMLAIKQLEKRKRFRDELMIFYVALTRAKNKLVLFGKYDAKIFEKKNLDECKTYFDLVFNACDDMRRALQNDEKYEDVDVEAHVVNDVILKEIEKEDVEKNPEFETSCVAKIKEYLGFDYKYDDKLNFKLKEGVTSLNLKNLENNLEKYSNENFSFVGAGVEIGNAYHLAMENLDFEKIDSVDDIKRQIEQMSALFDGTEKLLNYGVLLENIKLVKSVVSGATLYKEKRFIMKEKLCNLLEGVEYDDKILLQGAVDLFAVKKDEVVLIDYKYSNSTDKNYLINKYKNQIKFYKMAIENAFNLPVKNAYLLSLKHAELIKVEV